MWYGHHDETLNNMFNLKSPLPCALVLILAGIPQVWWLHWLRWEKESQTAVHGFLLLALEHIRYRASMTFWLMAPRTPCPNSCNRSKFLDKYVRIQLACSPSQMFSIVKELFSLHDQKSLAYFESAACTCCSPSAIRPLWMWIQKWGLAIAFWLLFCWVRVTNAASAAI